MSRTATARLTVPTQVNWVCSRCGNANQTVQPITYTGTAQGTSLLKNQEKLKAKAREDLWAGMEKAREKYNAGDFRAAKLRCVCAACGNAEPWARYSEIPNWAVFPLIAGLVGLFLNYVLIENTVLLAVSLALVILPLLVCWIVVSAKNGARKREIRALPRASWPRLTPRT